MDLKQQPWPMVAVGAAVIIFVGLAAYWFFGRGGDAPIEPTPTAVVEPAPSVPVTPDPEPFALPALDDSDAVVRDLVAALSAHPGLAAWLVTDGLIRRFVVAVDNIADGSNPAQHVPFMRPDTRFRTAGEEPELRIDPASFSRYDTHAQIVASLDTDGIAELYRRLLPLMDEAYAELGYPDTTFSNAFARAVAHLLEAPVIEGQPALVPRASFFEYTDDELESLSPAHKQFIGMGPENMRAVQAKIREIATAIGIGDLPRGSVLLR